MHLLSRSLCSLAAALVLTAAASAASFEFSYTFGSDGTLVTGTLEGDANGSYVDNVTNVTLSIGGTPVDGTLYLAQFNGVDFSTGSVVSFDVGLNNFLFSNTDFANGDPFGSYFGLYQDAFGAFAATYSEPLALSTQDTGNAVAAWTLTATSTNVPDATSTAALLTLATLGLVALRRRHRQS